jgi:DNA-binding MarR family transcriptional regulator
MKNLQIKMRGRRWQILAIIQANPGYNESKIAKVAQISYSTVYYHLLKLKKDNLIEFEKKPLSVRYFVKGAKEIKAINGESKKVCSFCGEIITKTVYLFNIWFPSIVFCSNFCKNSGISSLSDNDLTEIMDSLPNLPKHELES